MQNLPKHILVIRLSAMGDVAMTIPVIRALTSQYPHTKITVLTRLQFKPLFRDIENVSVYVVEINNRHKGVLGLKKLSRELRELPIDAVADLHNVLRSNILRFFFRKKSFIQIDKGRKEKKALTSGRIFKPLRSTHERYADVFRKLGFEIHLSNPIFPQKKALNTRTTTLIGEYNGLIGIAPFAAYEGKSYPIYLMERVIESLSNNKKVLLFGGGVKEIKVLNDLEIKYNNVINLSGKLNLEEELDIISQLDLMLAMDSANAHLAAMLGIPTVTIWGVTHPFAGFLPFNQPLSNTLIANKEKFPLIPTSVYGKKYPKGYEKAIVSVEPQKIIDKVNSIL